MIVFSSSLLIFLSSEVEDQDTVVASA